MFIKVFPLGMFQSNCILMGDLESRFAIVVDPGDEVDRIISELESRDLRLECILLTHAHLDHIGAVKALHAKYGGDVYLNNQDRMLYDNLSVQAQDFGLEMDGSNLPVPQHLEDGMCMECGRLHMKVLHTPGHTPGSVCFLFERVMFPSEQGSVKEINLVLSGDTLFLGSIGRTDLPGGDHHQLLSSIRDKLFVLPNDTIVLPGHGPQTTIDFERHNNPFF